MRISPLLLCLLIPLGFASCKKDEDPGFSNASLRGVWLSSASGEDTNGNLIFDAGERVDDNGSYEWTFQSDDTLVIKSRISSTAPLIKEWYRVDGDKFYRSSLNGGFSQIVRLSGGRFVTRTEMPAGFAAAWLELRRQ